MNAITHNDLSVSKYLRVNDSLRYVFSTVFTFYFYFGNFTTLSKESFNTYLPFVFHFHRFSAIVKGSRNGETGFQIYSNYSVINQ